MKFLPFAGTAVYSRLDYYPGYPYSLNTNGIEITISRFIMFPQATINDYCNLSFSKNIGDTTM
jgi:hypothetical protein